MLRRSDINLFKIVSESVATTAAAQLSAGHVFEVNHIASLKVDSVQETAFLDAMNPFHTFHGWYATDLDKLLSTWLDCLEGSPEPESLLPSQRQDNEAGNTTSNENVSDENASDDDLLACLQYCDAADAPLAAVIRKFVFNLMGKVEGKLELAKLVSKTTKRNGIVRRLYYYNNKAVSHNLQNIQFK